jgi:uncharacterized membrane protein
MDYSEPPEFSDGEYGAIEVPDAWHVVSLACFAGALGARFLAQLFPRGWMPPWSRPLLPAVTVLVLAILGLLFGLVGLRSAQGRGAARIAVFLNATVLALGLLGVAAFFYILPG